MLISFFAPPNPAIRATQIVLETFTQVPTRPTTATVLGQAVTYEDSTSTTASQSTTTQLSTASRQLENFDDLVRDPVPARTRICACITTDRVCVLYCSVMACMLVGSLAGGLAYRYGREE